MISKELLKELHKYVDEYLASIELSLRENICYSEPCLYAPILENEMTSFINTNKKPSFNNLLFKYIDKSGVLDSHVYKLAGIDRRHFSKIRSNPDYHPSKNTAIALAFQSKATLRSYRIAKCR